MASSGNTNAWTCFLVHHFRRVRVFLLGIFQSTGFRLFLGLYQKCMHHRCHSERNHTFIIPYFLYRLLSQLDWYPITRTMDNVYDEYDDSSPATQIISLVLRWLWWTIGEHEDIDEKCVFIWKIERHEFHINSDNRISSLHSSTKRSIYTLF